VKADGRNFSLLLPCAPSNKDFENLTVIWAGGPPVTYPNHHKRSVPDPYAQRTTEVEKHGRSTPRSAVISACTLLLRPETASQKKRWTVDSVWVACAVVTATNFLVQSLWIPFLKAYAEAKAKTFASKEDINVVVEQLRLTTRATAAIQAEISGGLWLSQWQLGQKRDAYVRLIDALECIQVQRGLQRKGVQEAKHGERDAIAEFRRARALARLMLPPEVIVSIGRLLREIKKVDPTTATDPDYFESKERIEHARDAVVKAGKVDLALNPARAGGPTTT